MTDIVEQATYLIHNASPSISLRMAGSIAQDLADAGLVREPARTVPTREQIAEVVDPVKIDSDGLLTPRTPHEITDAVLALMADQPTVAEAKAQALEEAADAWHAENTGTSPRAYRWLQHRAQEIREEQ